ncbi:polyketide synthase [Pendulispora albinea]|uniref:Polyketide synthase n=2 Tax=Pendulispora albinea TaxID=2741071 RepID=A0ABZ2LLJ8_9BACT
MGCRFPGAEGPAAFWKLLREGRHALSSHPADRWNTAAFCSNGAIEPGKAYCRVGGFVEDGDAFDRRLFGIGSEESAAMDPQQGMALEVAWHALEHAGINPRSLERSPTGVYFGFSTRDFDRRVANRFNGLTFDSSTGSSGAVIANRISYTLGLTGPSIAIDAACASSITSVHLACQGLWLEECELAIAGGVQLILSPANMVAFSHGRLLSQHGLTRSFSADADGYVCGEGAGALVLKRLSDALADGDRVLATIVGSAVQHNGPSNGLSAPFGEAQQRVLQAALQQGGVPAASIGYLEAHSAGTMLGDVIEVRAAVRALSEARDLDRRCYIGSVKSNLGHLEGAAGIASLIKSILAIEHGEVPPSLHAERENAQLKLSGTPFRVAHHLAVWPSGDGPRRAGVSSFSFGGAVCHMVLEQAPALPGVLPGDQMLPTGFYGPLIISANSPAALMRLVERHVAALNEVASGREYVAYCATAAGGRAHLPYGIAIVAGDPASAIDELRRILGSWEQAPRAAARRTGLMVRLSTAAEPRPSDWPGPWNARWQAYHAEERRMQGDPRVAECVASDLAQLRLLEDLGVVPDGLIGHGDELDRRAKYLADRLSRGPEHPRPKSLRAGAGPMLDLVPSPIGGGSSSATLLARLYENGFFVDWRAYYAAMTRTRSHQVPVYPFERARHWTLPASDDATLLDVKHQMSVNRSTPVAEEFMERGNDDLRESN